MSFNNVKAPTGSVFLLGRNQVIFCCMINSQGNQNVQEWMLSLYRSCINEKNNLQPDPVEIARKFTFVPLLKTNNDSTQLNVSKFTIRAVCFLDTFVAFQMLQVSVIFSIFFPITNICFQLAVRIFVRRQVQAICIKKNSSQDCKKREKKSCLAVIILILVTKRNRSVFKVISTRSVSKT